MEVPSIMGSRAPRIPTMNEDMDEAVMARNGITRIVTHHYLVDGYRYTTLADALSQVRRGAPGRVQS